MLVVKMHGLKGKIYYQSKKSTGDYHTSQNCEEWFHDNVKPKSVLVIDNVSYHSRKRESVPTMNFRKQVMQD